MRTVKHLAMATSMAALLLAGCSPGGEKGGQSTAVAESAIGSTKYELDAKWPKPLPNNWQIGPLLGIHVDRHGLIWTTNTSSALDNYDTGAERGEADCCVRAPEVLVFNEAGDVVKSWRTSGEDAVKGGYKSSAAAHTIYVDHKDNVWLTGHGPGETHVLKFDYNGKLLLQIGGSDEPGCCGNYDTKNVHGGTGIAVWPETNEVFVTDGYENRRVIVFDADTGEFKRMWGAYGKPPPKDAYDPKLKRMYSAPSPQRFEGPGADTFRVVHGVAISNDGVVWIADRANNRIQRFKIDGTYIDEFFVSRHTTQAFGMKPENQLYGTVYNIAFTQDPEQSRFFVGDGGNKKVHIFDRKTLKEIGYIGGCGGQMNGCFNHVHLGVPDAKGYVYTGEGAAGRRIQRWIPVKE